MLMFVFRYSNISLVRIAPYYDRAIDSSPIAKRQFTQCTSQQGDCEKLLSPDPLACRIICATRMYRGLIAYDVEVYGTPSHLDR
jgi:hypothetical protein